MSIHPKASLALVPLLAVTLTATPVGAGADADVDAHTLVLVPSTGQTVRAYQHDGRIISLYGRPMAGGANAEASAEVFVEQHLDLFSPAPGDLRPGVDYGGGAFAKGLVYDKETERYKFTLLRYSQHAGDTPVFRAELKVLARNEPGFPVVLGGSSLRDLSGLEIERAGAPDRGVDRGLALQIAQRELGAGVEIVEGPDAVVFAGVDLETKPATLAMQFTAKVGAPQDGDRYAKWLYVVEPATGRVLFAENLVCSIDVTGNVSGWSTEDFAADICGPQIVTPLPYARVGIDATTTFADVNGDFVIPNAGSEDVTVDSEIRGEWFRVFNSGGPESTLSQVVTPPGPADFVYNEGDEEFTTAEVNCYIHANLVRDYVLGIDPDFPVITSDFEFPVNVNVDGACNAFYDGSSINFFRSQDGGCPNEGFSIVVYHEYGHHLVAIGTGSQCQWGEGMSDVTGVLVSDTPENAIGFFGDCEEPLRNADNDCQYDSSSCSSCGGPCHNCGQLISGCVWSLRNELLVTEPDRYREILGTYAIGSLFLHSTGSTITPQVTIDYLVLDDDDGNLENGTPHYFEIADAFGDHSMDAPPVIFLEFDLPDGLPPFVSPSGGTTVRLGVTANVHEPRPDSGVLHVDTGDGFVEIPMTEIETNLYEGAFPATDCGNIVKFFFTVETTQDVVMPFPIDAPDSFFLVLAADGTTVVVQDDFEQDLGWTVETDAQHGAWERGVPAECTNGNPDGDGDGSGQCYMTENLPDPCLSDVDFGETILTSPVFDASDEDSLVSYYRWYHTGRVRRDDPFIVEVSPDAGATWTELERVEAEGEDANAGWIFVAYLVSNFVENTDEFQIRFRAMDTGQFSDVEAAVDGVTIRSLSCGACDEDLDGSGDVGTGDLVALLAAWGPCDKDCPEDLNGNGVVELADLLILLAAWGPCP